MSPSLDKETLVKTLNIAASKKACSANALSVSYRAPNVLRVEERRHGVFEVFGEVFAGCSCRGVESR